MEGSTHSEVASSLATGEDSNGELPPVPPRKGRIRLHLRVSCIVVVLIFIATYLSPFATPALAASGNTVHMSKGMRVVDNADGSRGVAFLPTFRKWDGTHQLMSSLDFPSGNWPYLVQQSPTTFSINYIGRSFTQAKIPGASYEFSPTAIKETIKVPDKGSVPTGKISATLTSTYSIQISGLAVQLLNSSGTVSWGTANFVAWDSSPNPSAYPIPVTDLLYQPGVLVMVLNATMLAQATYPLYIDPTWVLKADVNNNWAGTLDHASSDWGDHKLKIGYKADNFDDNINEIWSIGYGTDFSNWGLAGGRAFLYGYIDMNNYTAFGDLKLQSTMNWVARGVTRVYFRDKDPGDFYMLYIAPTASPQYVQLSKEVAFTSTTISPQVSQTMAANTNYDVRIVAKGNYFEIWWNGALLWSGSDSSPPATPLSGLTDFQTSGATTNLTLDNIRFWSPTRNDGTFSSNTRDAGTANVPTQVKYLGSADGYNSVDLWINSSSVSVNWGGWHLAKSSVTPGINYQVPDVDQKRYYKVRAALRTGNNNTPTVSEIDITEAAPPAITASTNTGLQPWYFFVGGMVNAISGNLFSSSSDISIQAKGFPIAIGRAYNSVLSGSTGPFGLGTTYNFNANLAFPGGGNVTLNDGDGAAYTFVTLGGNYYSPPRGLHHDLIKNGDGSYSLWRLDGSKANFDSTGKLTRIVDKNGSQLTLTYASGKLTQVADGSGLYLNIAYDASNRIQQITDPMGRRVSYTYDGSNHLTQFTDPMGFTTNYSYDGTSGRLARIVDPAGGEVRFVYNANQAVGEVWRGEWNFATNSVKWEFKAYAITYTSGSQTDVTDARGSVTHITFNSLGNPTHVSGPAMGNFGVSGNSTGYTWDGEFDPLSTTDGRGNTVTNTYDWMGNLLTTKDPGGNVSTRTFTNVQTPSQFISLPTSATSARGYTTNYIYDAKGNLVTVRDVGGNTSTNYYDTAGSLAQVKDFRGNSVKYGYDSHEFLINTTDAGGNVTTYQNDPIGRTWNTTTPLGFISRAVSDANGRVTTVTDPMGNSTTYTYNKRGDRTKVTDANLLSTQYAINMTLGSIQKVIDPGGNTTTYVYNNTSNLLQVVDANNHSTNYGYDIYQRQVTVKSPMGYLSKVGYDAAGNVLWRIDATGSKTNYTYDRSNRLYKTLYPNGQSLRVTYDRDGNVIDRKGLELEEKYIYDKLDRVVSTQQIFLNAALTLYANYTYDPNGNRLSISGNGGGSYTWDASNRLFIRADGSGSKFTYAYDKDGRSVKLSYPDGEINTYAYNGNGWPINTTTKRSDVTLIESFNYTYDKVGNRLSMKEFRVFQADYSPLRCGVGVDCTSYANASGLQRGHQYLYLR